MTTLAAARLCAAATTSGEAVLPDGPGWVRVEGGTIAAVGAGPAPSGADDLGDVTLVPGFVDLQVNGWGPVDFGDSSPDAIAGALADLAHGGLTACLPTLVTAPLDAYAERLARLRAAIARPGATTRAAVLGVHLEGPFLGGAPGAHPVDLVRRVDLDWLTALLDEWGDLVRLVTLAPEADPGLAATRLLASRGVVVALGHSACGYDDARAAAAAGARLVTHLFNGMGPLHHRAPGLSGAALDDPRLVPSLIADLVHVHPALVRLAITARPDAVLVSDAVGVDAGASGGLAIHEEGGVARLADGTIAGSVLTMAHAVANVAGLGFPLEQAVAMASTHPARVLGLADRGRLVPGARADLVALDRATLAVRGVWLSGRPLV